MINIHHQWWFTINININVLSSYVKCRRLKLLNNNLLYIIATFVRFMKPIVKLIPLTNYLPTRFYLDMIYVGFSFSNYNFIINGKKQLDTRVVLTKNLFHDLEIIHWWDQHFSIHKQNKNGPLLSVRWNQKIIVYHLESNWQASTTKTIQWHWYENTAIKYRFHYQSFASSSKCCLGYGDSYNSWCWCAPECWSCTCGSSGPYICHHLPSYFHH